MILMKLLPLIPAAQLIVWVMIGVALWLGRDLVLDRLRRRIVVDDTSLQHSTAVPIPVRRRVRWKLALLSGLAATELILMLVGVTA
jgi:hypothetical protein